MSTTEAFTGTNAGLNSSTSTGTYAHQFFQQANATQAQQLSQSMAAGGSAGVTSSGGSVLISSQQFCYAGLPDPTSVQKQKETYLRLLDSQLQQGVQALDVQLKQQRDAINSQAEQQKKAFDMQVDMEVKAQEMQLQQQYQEQHLQLQQQAQQQKSQLEQQAMQLSMDYQQKKAEEEMQKAHYEMERQQQELQMKLQNEFHSMQAQLTSSLPAAFQFYPGMVVSPDGLKQNGSGIFTGTFGLDVGTSSKMDQLSGTMSTATQSNPQRAEPEVYVYGPNGELIPKNQQQEHQN
eukprot:g1109.t1